MAFFDKMKESLNKGTATVSIKAQTMLELNKVKAEISNLEKQKKDTLEAIGERMVEMKRAGAISVEEVEPMVLSVFEVEAKLAEKELEKQEVLKKEEEALKATGAAPAQEAQGGIVCECGEVLAPGTKFCPKCGKKQDE
ncbi:zinc ribbon domain-containing protein [Anaerotalea alkaliphila]|uniref:Zinc ribbon domain-containing protein n=1 Tax=Anaerotalea alkaliphila TaxID=2662126 RepID=A0A7X5HVD8_9FIRM|nr:zinc ribbon domain-containing protein [Anaerotalea alkaliphila]NDL67345.1 zinc ribbon domain-containing protein [Anaerotalea alkaliphila]